MLGKSGNTKGGFDWFGISCMTKDIFCFYLQNRLIQTSQTGGQWYSDTFPLSIPWVSSNHRFERITSCKLTIISESAICKKFLGQIWSYTASL